jgi:hypothetical protein
MAGLMAKYRLYTKLKSNLRGDANLFARLTWVRGADSGTCHAVNAASG